MEQTLNHEPRGRLTKDGIRIYDDTDFAGMHAAGRLAAEILDAMSAHVFVGQTTGEIDRIITQMVNSKRRKTRKIENSTFPFFLCFLLFRKSKQIKKEKSWIFYFSFCFLFEFTIWVMIWPRWWAAWSGSVGLRFFLKRLAAESTGG